VGILVRTLEFTLGAGSSVSDIDREIYALIGHIAEQVVVVTRTVAEDVIQYDLIVGSLGAHAHAHQIKLEVGGRNMAKILGRYREIQASS